MDQGPATLTEDQEPATLTDYLWGDGVFPEISEHGSEFVLKLLWPTYPLALAFLLAFGFWFVTRLCDCSPLFTCRMPKLRPKSAAVDRAAGRLGNCIGMLDFLGATAPMLGLLGTVFGIRRVFVDIQAMDTISADVVAPGFGEALETTGLGLLIAFFALAFRTVFGPLKKKSHRVNGEPLQQHETPLQQLATKATAEPDEADGK